MTTRTAVILGLGLLACKKDNTAPAAGSASTTPPPVIAADAAPPKPDATPIDAAPPPAAFDESIRSDGVGPVKSDTDPTTLGALFPGLDNTVDSDVGEDHEIETTTFTVHGAPVLDVVVDKMLDAKHVFRVDVTGSMLATHDGIRIGSTVAEFLAKDDSLTCKRETYTENAEGFTHALLCVTAKLPNLSFYLDDKKLPGHDGKVINAKVANMKFNRIIWANPTAH